MWNDLALFLGGWVVDAGYWVLVNPLIGLSFHGIPHPEKRMRDDRDPCYKGVNEAGRFELMHDFLNGLWQNAPPHSPCLQLLYCHPDAKRRDPLEQSRSNISRTFDHFPCLSKQSDILITSCRLPNALCLVKMLSCNCLLSQGSLILKNEK